MKRPRVSVVVVNYNGAHHLATFLDSLREVVYDGDELEVIVVDNASHDGSRELLSHRYPWVHVLAQRENIGFGGGNNVGAEHARGRRLVFLNNDMRVDPRFLAELERALDDTGAACAGARILDWEGATVDFAGAALHFAGFAYQEGYTRKVDALDNGTIRPILFACGGAMMVDRDIYLEVGGFDGDYFATYEDSDLGWRLWILGHDVVYAPGAVVYHRHHGTLSGLAEHRRDVLYRRNALVSAIKNYEDENLRRILPAALLGTLAGIGEGVALRGVRELNRPADRRASTRSPARKSGHVYLSPPEIATLRALQEIAANLPRILAKRKRIQTRRRRSDADVAPLFRTPFGPWPGVGPPLQHRVAAGFAVQEIFAHVPRKVAVVARPGDGDWAKSVTGGLREKGHDVVHVVAEGHAAGVGEDVYEADPQLVVVCGTALFATLLPLGLWMPLVVALDNGEAPPPRERAALAALGRADAVLVRERGPDLERTLRRAGWTPQDLDRQILVSGAGAGAAPLDAFARRPVMRIGYHEDAPQGLLARAQRAYRLGGPVYVVRRAAALVARRLRGA